MRCPECGVYGEVSEPGLSRWQCEHCGNAFFLRRCAACARVSYVDGLQGFRTPWSCTWCGQSNEGFSQNRDPASASVAELAEELGRFGADLPVAPGLPGAPGFPAEPAPGPPPRPRRRGRRIAFITGLAVVAVVACVLVLTQGGAAAGRAASLVTHTAGTRSVDVTANQVASADFQGVQGQLTITGTKDPRATLTGEVDWSGHPPVVRTRLDRGTGALEISVQCPHASQCTENLQLNVPADAAITVHEPAGHVVLTSLTGPLRVDAANADVSATGLRSPDLTAQIRSGHLSAAFAAPPRQVAIALNSAQATLRLPSSVRYRVTRQVASGYVGIAIPQAAKTDHAVTARLDSSELELLPA